MKRYAIITAAMATMICMVSLPAAFADNISVGDTISLNWSSSGVNSTGGGPYLLTDITTGDSFLTFCLEKNEYFSLNGQMIIDSISQSASNGGIAGGNPDPLSEKTAWLYRHFREGDLWSLTSIADTATNRFNLQNAIWMIEQELTPGSNAFISFLNANPTVYSAADLSVVHVINPIVREVTGAITFKQSQLTYTPVPEPSSLLLLGGGLLAAAGFIRKRH